MKPGPTDMEMYSFLLEETKDGPYMFYISHCWVGSCIKENENAKVGEIF